MLSIILLFSQQMMKKKQALNMFEYFESIYWYSFKKQSFTAELSGIWHIHAA
jgi:hypothetical protein